jgi:hypothetical protein
VEDVEVRVAALEEAAELQKSGRDGARWFVRRIEWRQGQPLSGEPPAYEGLSVQRHKPGTPGPCFRITGSRESLCEFGYWDLSGRSSVRYRMACRGCTPSARGQAADAASSQPTCQCLNKGRGQPSERHAYADTFSLLSVDGGKAQRTSGDSLNRTRGRTNLVSCLKGFRPFREPTSLPDIFAG